ncbi:uncharacterized protein A4U43_C06F15840 [Asparagus officinalis]|uniref:PRONE domain-containing protein n=1 Tax=Asparagus officinalis TaxID=4686 RepID=A0A5P1EM83_ASPOF|nr:uncharacterized protein A4U43_C06F15840 [Asparagus officinalis]
MPEAEISWPYTNHIRHVPNSIQQGFCFSSSNFSPLHNSIFLVTKTCTSRILESTTRVFESLAFNIVARINDLLYVDDLSKHSDQKNAMIPCSILIFSTPYATAYGTPSFSPVPLISLACGEKTPFSIRKGHNQGFSVKKVLSDYLN